MGLLIFVFALESSLLSFQDSIQELQYLTLILISNPSVPQPVQLARTYLHLSLQISEETRTPLPF